MENKEVEKAIKIVLAVRGTYDSYNDMMFGTGYADKEVQGAIDTVLNYIEEDVIPKQVIRDKIKELEHEKFKRTQLGVFMLKNYENQRLLAQIQVLKEILGE